MTVKEFNIDRANLGKGLLLNPATGKMCCIGMYLTACGVPNKVIAKQGMASDLSPKQLPAEAKWLLETSIGGFANSGDANSIAATNDQAPTSSSKPLEKSIVETFAKNGVKATFVGKKP